MKYIKKYWKLVCYLFAVTMIILGIFKVIPFENSLIYWCVGMMFILLPRICDDVIDAMKGENND